MSTTHVYFADMPLATAATASQPEGHSSLDVLNDDAIRQCRSISPNCNSNSPIPRYERNMGFFRQLSRRFGLRSNDDLVFSANSNEDDTQSSSTDSCSSSAANAVANAHKRDNQQRFSAATTDYISCASSETSSTVDIEEQLQQQQQQSNISNNHDSSDNIDNAEVDNNENSDDMRKCSSFNKERKSFARSSFSRLHRRSTSSLRRAFEAFSLSSRSLSCSGATPPTNLPTSSATNAANNLNGTPIKSALKSSSNLELNKHTPTTKSCNSSSCLKKSSSSSSSSSSSAAKSSTLASSSSSSSSSASKSKSKPPPQRILRQPVSYTYLKGISGLPTQRVPRNSVCCQYARR